MLTLTLKPGEAWIQSAHEADNDCVAIQTPELNAMAFCCKHAEPASAGEDCVGVAALKPRGSLLIVADGVGGEYSGELASRMAVEGLTAVAQNNLNDTDQAVAQTLQHIMKTNQSIMDLTKGAATTMTAALVFDQVITFFHIGDSFASLISQRGKLKHKTIAQSSFGYAKASNIDFSDTIAGLEEHHWLRSALGHQPLMIETTQYGEHAKRDTLLLGSDGISDNLSLKDIYPQLRVGALKKKTLALKSSLEAFMQTEQGHVDDYTFISARFR